MRTTGLLFLPFVACRGPAHEAPPVPSETSPDTGTPPAEPAFPALDAHLQALIDEGTLVGVAAALVVGADVVWVGAAGAANLETGAPVTAHTPFLLASISKLTIAASVMRAVEDGQLALEEPVDDLLLFGVDNPHVTGESITPLHLVTHTSGIYDRWVWGALGEPDALYVLGDSPIPLGVFLDGFLVDGGAWYAPDNYTPFPPGERYVYSNVGAALAAYVVEETTQQSFEAYSHAQVFAPLGMTDTAWRLSELDEALVAMPYDLSDGTPQPFGHFGYPDYPDGLLRSSAADMGRFLAAHMNGGSLDGVQVLEPESVAALTTAPLPDVDPTQGLIWFDNAWGDLTGWGHSGSDYGVATDLRHRDGVGLIVMVNVDWSSTTTAAIHELELAMLAAGDAL